MLVHSHAPLLALALATASAHAQPFTPVDDLTTTPRVIGPNIAALAQGPAGALLAFRSTNEGVEPWFLPAGSTTAHLVADIKPGPADGFYATNQPTYLRPLGNGFVFSAANAYGRLNLWATSGAPGDARLLADLWADNDNEPRDSALLGERLVFATQQGLWITDGTPSGTTRLARVQDPQQLTAAGGKVFFIPLDSRGREVWVTDGTAAGTRMLRDITAEYSDVGPNYLTAWNGELYFVDRDHSQGPQDTLWRSDGTEAGTRRIIQLPSYPFGPRNLTPYRGLLYFAVSTASGQACIAATDGTAGGTAITFPEFRADQLFAVGDSLLLFGRYPGGASSLALSDGTEQGTHFVATYLDGTAPYTLQRQDGRVLFTLGTDEGWGPWTSDGTPIGTRRLSPPAIPFGQFMSATLMPGWILMQYQKAGTNDTYPFRYSEQDQSLTPITGFEFEGQDPSFITLTAASGNTLAFLADATVRATTGGPSTPLATFTSDDLSSSTRFLAFAGPDLLLGAAGLWRLDPAGPARLAGPTLPGRPTADAGRLFFAADGLGGGVEPWVYAGGGAQRLGDLSASSSNPASFTRAGALVYFHAATALGRELWATEGTPQTTRRITDLAPGSASGVWSGATANPLGAGMGSLGDRILFAGATSGQNYELWASRGSDPSLIAELTPGTTGSFPGSFTPIHDAAGDALYFFASNLGLYRLRPGALPTLVFRSPGATLPRAVAASGGTLFILNGPRQGVGEPPAPCTLWAILDPAFPPQLVAEVSPSGSPEPPSTILTPIGDTGWVALVADTPATGRELMLSRGVPADLGGTRIVELAPGPWSSNISQVIATADALYAVGTDGPHGVELYRAALADLGLSPPCATDFNRDGFTDFFDYDDFVRCVEGGACPPARNADFNHDGFADFFDYGDFVLAFETGC